MMLNRNAVTAAFEDYVSGYNAQDPKIKLKIDHTTRVAALCERIAADVTAADVELAWLCGIALLCLLCFFAGYYLMPKPSAPS